MLAVVVVLTFYCAPGWTPVALHPCWTRQYVTTYTDDEAMARWHNRRKLTPPNGDR